MGSMSDNPHGLNDPDYAAFAWARYRRILARMGLATVAAVTALEIWYGPLSWVAILSAVAGSAAR